MQVLMCGLDHTTTPLDVRERVAFGEATLPRGLAALLGRAEILEGAILSTCNRTELYAVVSAEAAGREALREVLLEVGGLTAEELDAHGRFRVEADAVAHLFRVAAGLESQVLGEGQILAQVKEAIATARRHGMVGALLDPIFRFALGAGKRVRAQTGITRGTVSVASAGLELARTQLGGLAGRRALVLGAGRMAELTARQLAAEKACRVTIASRSLEPARALAAQVGGEALPFHDLHAALVAADLVVCCTDAPHFVLGAADFASVAAGRHERPLLLLDLAVPRNLDPALAAYPGVTLRDVDALTATAQAHRLERATMVAAAEAILATELAAYQAWRDGVPLNPAIAELSAKFTEVGERELEGFLGRHAQRFTPEQRALVEGLTRSVVNKLLHQPLAQLKGTAAGRQPHMIQALELLYGLNIEAFGDYYHRRLAERRGAVTAGA